MTQFSLLFFSVVVKFRAEQKIQEEKIKAEQRERLEKLRAELKEREEKLKAEQREREERIRAEQRAMAEEAAANSKIVGEYEARIIAKIRRNIVIPPDIPYNAVTEFELALLPGGMIFIPVLFAMKMLDKRTGIENEDDDSV